MHAFFRYLNIDVAIPRQDLSIPPPTQQGAMHYPCFHTYVVESSEVCLHKVGEIAFALDIIEFVVGKATIVVWMED